jgi:hypothetical protein
MKGQAMPNQGQSQNMKGQQSNMKGQQGMNMYGGMNGGLYSQGGQNSILWQPNMGNYTGAATSAMAGQTGQNYGQQLPSNAAGAPSAQGFQGMGQGYFGGQGPQSPWSSQSNPAGQSGGVGTGTGDMHRYASTANLFGGR